MEEAGVPVVMLNDLYLLNVLRLLFLQFELFIVFALFVLVVRFLLLVRFLPFLPLALLVLFKLRVNVHLALISCSSIARSP